MQAQLYKTRLTALRERLEAGKCDAFISVDPVDNAHLTGFFGTTSCLLVSQTQALLICDFRYIEQARAQAQGVEVLLGAGNLDTRLAEHLDALGARNVAFEPDAISVGRHDDIASTCNAALLSCRGMYRTLREKKDPDEIARIRAATEVTEAALETMLEALRPGVSEREMAGLLEYEFRRRGARRAAFDTIVQFGENSALPHGMPGDRRLQSGDCVLVDCGCMLDGYCADLTRSFVFDRIPGDWYVDVYETVRAAQAAAVDAAAPGIACRTVDAAARTRITDAGHGEHFGHGTGHGVGLEVHEAPRLNAMTTTTLEAGMVVTVEPGIYLPGMGGVRIEDLLVITASGKEQLTSLPKELRILKQ